MSAADPEERWAEVGAQQRNGEAARVLRPRDDQPQGGEAPVADPEPLLGNDPAEGHGFPEGVGERGLRQDPWLPEGESDGASRHSHGSRGEWSQAGASEHDTNWWWQRFVRWQQQGWSSQQIFSYLAAQGEGGHYADKWRNGRWGCGRSWEPQWEKSSGSEATSGWSERAEEQWAGDEEHDKKQHAWQGGWAKASSFDPWAQAAAAKLANNSRRESGQGSEGTGGERPSEKIPVPTFTGAAGEEGEVGSTARSYLRRVEAWERVTRMPAGQRGVALYTALKDKAWVEAEALDLNKLSGEQGAKYMKDFIKERYMDIEVTQVGRSMTQFFRVLKRNHDDSVRTFIGEFDRQVARLAEVQVVLPETVLAWMFLDKLRLDEAGEISLLASVRNEYSLKRLQEAALIHPEAPC